jgi:hypothetical protein
MVREILLSSIADSWLARVGSMGDYLRATFGCQLDCLPTFDTLFIAETSDGIVASDYIGSEFSSKWTVYNGVLKSIDLESSHANLFHTDSSGTVYLMPSVIFCVDDASALVSERYGPNLKHRLRGRVVDSSDLSKLSIEWESLWKSTDI